MRVAKEKPPKPEKPKKEGVKARAGVLQPTPKPKPKPASHQQTVIRGITYYKASRREEAEGLVSSRGEYPAVQGSSGLGGAPRCP